MKLYCMGCPLNLHALQYILSQYIASHFFSRPSFLCRAGLRILRSRGNEDGIEG